MALVSIFLCIACGDDLNPPDIPDTTTDAAPEEPLCEPAPPGTTATSGNPGTDPLMWKGPEPLLNDLGRALGLTREQVCNEFGTVPCAELYRISLGGSDPFGVALYRPVDMPLSTTPTVVERVVLSACLNRITLDSDPATPAVVFNHIDLDASSLDPGSTQIADQIRVLYRRVLGRAPTEPEMSVLTELATPIAGQATSARDFAVSACLAIASSTEFLFI